MQPLPALNCVPLEVCQSMDAFTRLLPFPSSVVVDLVLVLRYLGTFIKGTCHTKELAKDKVQQD